MTRPTFKALAVDTASETAHSRETAYAEYFRHITGIEGIVQGRDMLDMYKGLTSYNIIMIITIRII